MKNILLAAVMMALPTLASASQITVHASAFTNSCGYFSNVASEIWVDYTNYDIDPDSQLVLHYGFNGLKAPSDEEILWQDIRNQSRAVGQNQKTQFTINKVLHSRSEAQRLTDLVFAVKIIAPDGSVTWDKGSFTSLGYYQVKLWPANADLPCVSENRRPPLLRQDVAIIEKG